MKEIKFRLRIENRIVGYETWYPGSFPSAQPKWLYGKDDVYRTPEYIYHSHKDQFIGLTDKTGKNIYEGDIVEFDSTLMQVVWENSKFVFWQKGWSEIHNPNADSKVIGNIYEQPELLK